MKNAVLILGLIPVLVGQAFAQEAIATTAKRTAAIEAQEKRLAAKAEPLPTTLRNPYSMSGFEAVVAKVEPTKTNEPAAPANLLTILADKIDAKARIVMGGEPMLLTGKQRLRVGSIVPVQHDGLIYEVEIAEIDTVRFTVRYKTEEYTRPIAQKPSGK